MPTNKELQSSELKSEQIDSMAVSKNDRFLSLSILTAAIILAGAWIYTTGLKADIPQKRLSGANSDRSISALEERVLPSDGVVLPVRWNDLGVKLTNTGVIDKKEFESLYDARARLPDGQGGLGADEKKLLESSQNGNLKISQENSGFILNLLWALGLGNKNDILEKGPMTDPQYGGAGRFASTGGWTIAVGNPMNHYSAHQFITLTADEQALVERVAKNIYRPCCGNSVYFPDCNHGMAMLGLLELMASQGISEEQMYKTALAVNSYWFPNTYLTIARYFESKGTRWSAVDPREVLGAAYSSAQGYARIQTLVAPEPQTQSQGGCGVNAGEQAQPVIPQRQEGGCGV